MDQSLRLSGGHLRRYLPFCVLVPALLAAILMTVAFFTQYDAPDANYFHRGAVLPVISGVLAALTAVIGTVLAFRMPRDILKPDSLPVPVASLVSAIGFLFCAVFLGISTARSGLDWTRIAALLLSLAAAAYALTVSFCDLRQESVRNLSVLLGFTPIFALIFLCASHYFDRSLEMNAPCKVFLMLGLLAAMLTSTGEIRFQLGSALPRAYLMLLSWTVAAGSLSIPAIPAAYCAGILKGTDYLASAFAVLGCTLTAALRLYYALAIDPSGSSDSTASGSEGSSESGKGAAGGQESGS